MRFPVGAGNDVGEVELFFYLFKFLRNLSDYRQINQQEREKASTFQKKRLAF
jgi:hypothetical protein